MTAPLAAAYAEADAKARSFAACHGSAAAFESEIALWTPPAGTWALAIEARDDDGFLDELVPTARAALAAVDDRFGCVVFGRRRAWLVRRFDAPPDAAELRAWEEAVDYELLGALAFAPGQILDMGLEGPVDAARLDFALPVWFELLADDEADDDGPPVFPLDVLPRSIATWCRAKADELETPADLPAALALGAAVAAIGAARDVRVRAGWVEALVLWFVVALRSGEAKSPAFSAATRPLYRAEAAQRADLAPKIRERRAERAVLLKLRSKAEKAAEDTPADVANVAEIDRRLAECPPIHEPRWILRDVTPEALADAMEKQGEAVAILSPEAGPLGSHSRYGSPGAGPNLDIFLSSWSAEALSVARMSRPPTFLESPRLSMVLTVQPSALADLRSATELRGRGFLARPIFALPVARVGTRTFDAGPTPERVQRGYEDAIGRLAMVRSEPTKALSMTAEAYAVLVAMRRRFESRIGAGGDLEGVADWVNKASSQAARLAGLLALFDAACESLAAVRAVETVEASHVVRGARVVEAWALPHAVRALGTIGSATLIDDASRRLLAWIAAREEGTARVRDVQRYLRPYKRATDARAALERLAALGLGELEGSTFTPSPGAARTWGRA